MSLTETSIRNLAGRLFEVGDNVVASNHSAFLGRVTPCRIEAVETAVNAETMNRETFVSALFFVPGCSDAVSFYVDPNQLFPSFEVASARVKVPKCLGRLVANVPFFAAVLASQALLGDERFETLDHWFGRLDALVDDNAGDLSDEARERIGDLRELVSEARLHALRLRTERRSRGGS